MGKTREAKMRDSMTGNSRETLRENFAFYPRVKVSLQTGKLREVNDPRDLRLTITFYATFFQNTPLKYF